MLFATSPLFIHPCLVYCVLYALLVATERLQVCHLHMAALHARLSAAHRYMFRIRATACSCFAVDLCVVGPVWASRWLDDAVDSLGIGVCLRQASQWP